MRPIFIATALVLMASGVAMAQNTTIQAAPPSSPTGSDSYQKDPGSSIHHPAKTAKTTKHKSHHHTTPQTPS